MARIGHTTASSGLSPRCSGHATRLSLLLALAAIAALPATAGATEVPAGATWSEATIPSSGGIVVKVADANGDWWAHVPTKQTVQIHGGSISLPFLPAARATGTIAGAPGTQLESYPADTVSVPHGTIDAAESAFSTP